MRTGRQSSNNQVSQTGWVVSQGLGSAIVFPFYHSDGGDTLFTIRNSHPSTSVKVQLYYVCEDTGNTIKVNLTVPAGGSATSLASSVDPDCAGYMIAVAKNTSTGFPINFNYLSGTAYITMDGHSGTFPGKTVKALSPIFPPSGNLKSTGARVIAPFDGVNYEFLTGPSNVASNLVLSGIKSDSIIALSSVSGDLTGAGVDSFRGLSATLTTTTKNIKLYINQPGIIYHGTMSELFPAVTDMNTILATETGKLTINPLGMGSLFGLVIQASGAVDRKTDETTVAPDSRYLGVPLV